MAKTDAVLNRKYPDLVEFFAKKEKARRERAHRPPNEKFKMVEKQRRLQLILKRARVVQKGEVDID